MPRGTGLLPERALQTNAGDHLSTPEFSLEFLMQQFHPAPKDGRFQMETISFGFKYGLPLEAELVMDVRCFPNPYSLPESKELDGKDGREEKTW